MFCLGSSYFDIELNKFGGVYMESFIKGNYKKSLFLGDNGYVVGLFKIKETDDDNVDLIGETVVFTGYFHELNDNDTYIFRGSFVIHAKYGEQFVVSSYERCMPEEKDAIVCYQTILENFSETAYGPKSRDILAEMGIEVKLPSQNEEELDEEF